MITIVTDSSSYFKKAEAAELGVLVIPMYYTVNNQRYYESYGDQNGDFENLLKGKAKVSTSQSNMGAFLSCFEEELTKNNQVLCITISSRLSGTFGSAYSAAKQTESDDIVVFDSRLTAGGMYLLIKETKKLIEKGMPLRDILRELPAIRDRITIAFSVDDITPLRNSGRLGFVRMSVSTILNIKPILLCEDGVVISDSVARGRIEIIKKLADKVAGNVSDVVINYIENQRAAADLYNVIKWQHPNAHIKLRKLGPILGIHLGLQVIGISFITK